MRVALVHDYLTQTGGAERVVLSLSRLFPDAPIYTSVYDERGTFPEFRDLDVRTTALQRLPHRGGAARGLLPLYPWAFGQLKLTGYDLVLSSSSGWAHATRAPGAFHLCYCYTPARWLYQTDRYLAEGGPLPTWSARALKPVFSSLRRWDQAAAQRPDAYVAMTSRFAQRIRETYGREAHVVPPPVDMNRIVPTASSMDPPYFLVVARLLGYRRVDLAIEACARMGRKLVIVGTGPAEAHLRDLARRLHADVRFMGRVSEHELNGLLHGCTALIQPGEEDFGLAPLEANAAGRPTVAYASGGALTTTLQGLTGVLFPEQTVESLVSALWEVQQRVWDGDCLREHAACFGEAQFHRRLTGVLADLGVVSRPTTVERSLALV